MNQDQRDKLLDLHRAATDELEKMWSWRGDPAPYLAADDAFREYLFSLPVSE